MFERGKKNPETVPVEESPLDRLVRGVVGCDVQNSSLFNLVLREAVLEKVLREDPAWPPKNPEDAGSMYNDCSKRYDAGELDEVVTQIDLNALIRDAGRLVRGSPDGAIPPRRLI